MENSSGASSGSSQEDEQFAIPFSESQKDFIRFLQKKGLKLMLVGGAVRDLCMGLSLPSDLDMEIRFSQKELGQTWAKSMLSLGLLIEEHYTIELAYLPFSILKMTTGDWTMELSLPRKEIYDQKTEAKGHREVEVILDNQLSPEVAAARRDFGFNSIGLAINEDYNGQFVDPRNGRNDLKNRVLKFNEHFIHDPVRFARLVRFHVKYGFMIDESSLSLLAKMDITYLTKHYFFYEGFKSGDIDSYFKTFFSYVQSFNLIISPALKDLDFLSELRKKSYKNYIDIFYELVYLDKDPEQIKLFANYVRLSKKNIRIIKNLMLGFRFFEPKDFQNHVIDWSDSPTNIVESNSSFKKMFRYIDFLKLYSTLSSTEESESRLNEKNSSMKSLDYLFSMDFSTIKTFIDQYQLSLPWAGREEFESYLLMHQPSLDIREGLSFYFHLKYRIKTALLR